jgi:hypothetical protein
MQDLGEKNGSMMSLGYRIQISWDTRKRGAMSIRPRSVCPRTKVLGQHLPWTMCPLVRKLSLGHIGPGLHYHGIQSGLPTPLGQLQLARKTLGGNYFFYCSPKDQNNSCILFFIFNSVKTSPIDVLNFLCIIQLVTVPTVTYFAITKCITYGYAAMGERYSFTYGNVAFGELYHLSMTQLVNSITWVWRN